MMQRFGHSGFTLSRVSRVLALLVVTAMFFTSVVPASVEAQPTEIATTANEAREPYEVNAARAQLLHGVPGVDLDIYGNDELLIAGMEYTTILDLGLSTQSDLRLTATVAGTSTVVAEISHPMFGPWPNSLILYLDLDGTVTSDVVPTPDYGTSGQTAGLSVWHHAAVGPTTGGFLAQAGPGTGTWSRIAPGLVEFEINFGPDLPVRKLLTVAPRTETIIHIVGDADSGLKTIAYTTTVRPGFARNERPLTESWSLSPKQPGPVVIYDDKLDYGGAPLDLTYTNLDGTVTDYAIESPLPSGNPATIPVVSGNPSTASPFVIVPIRPNWSRELVDASMFDWQFHTKSIHVFLDLGVITVVTKDGEVFRSPVAAGGASTPTPLGRTAITDARRVSGPSTILDLALFSDHVDSYGGELPQISILTGPVGGSVVGAETDGRLAVDPSSMATIVELLQPHVAGTQVTIWRTQTEYVNAHIAATQRDSNPCGDYTVTVDLALGQMPTDGDDVILGTPGPDVIAAGDGNDVICGLGGDDVIWGQGGQDDIYGGTGNDRIRGGDGNDTIYGGVGNDDLNGGRDNDRVLGGPGSDTAVRGGTGDDFVDGGSGDDLVVRGNGGSDVVIGGPGDDNLTGGPRPDWLYGADGNDVVKGNKGADLVDGGVGDDHLFGGPQPDQVIGTVGVDECNGGTELDVIDDGCESIIDLP